MQYWPASKGKVEVYDDITVTYTHEEQLANFVIRNFKIIKDGPVSGLISAHFINFLSIKNNHHLSRKESRRGFCYSFITPNGIPILA